MAENIEVWLFSASRYPCQTAVIIHLLSCHVMQQPPAVLLFCFVFLAGHETANAFDDCLINTCPENSHCVDGDCQYTCVRNEGYTGATCEPGMKYTRSPLQRIQFG